MPLKPEQRAEPESFGPKLIRQKLLEAGASRGAAVRGFKTAGYFAAKVTLKIGL
jgi:hypothetical protein